MNFKHFLVSLALLFAGYSGISQQTKERNTKISIPDIPGYMRNYLVGRQKEAEAFFKAALTVSVEELKGKNAPKLRISFTNQSQIPFQVKISSEFMIEDLPLGQLSLEAKDTTNIILYPVWQVPEELEFHLQVGNILVSPENALETILSVPTTTKSKE